MTSGINHTCILHIPELQNQQNKSHIMLNMTLAKLSSRQEVPLTNHWQTNCCISKYNHSNFITSYGRISTFTRTSTKTLKLHRGQKEKATSRKQFYTYYTEQNVILYIIIFKSKLRYQTIYFAHHI